MRTGRSRLSRCGSSRPATASTARSSTASCTGSPRRPPPPGYRVMLYTADGRRRRDRAPTRTCSPRTTSTPSCCTGTAPRRPAHGLAGRARRAVRDLRPAVGRARARPLLGRRRRRRRHRRGHPPPDRRRPPPDRLHRLAARVRRRRRPARRLGARRWPRPGWTRPASTARTDDGVDAGRGARARDLLAARRPPTALVCASDSLALGALRAVGGRRRRRSIGFDDTPVAQAVGLTSVSQPLPRRRPRCIGPARRPPRRRPGRHARQVLLQPSLVIRTTA